MNSEILEKLRKIEMAMVTRERVNEVVESIVVMSNEDTMRQIEDSERDFEDGNCFEVNGVGDLL